MNDSKRPLKLGERNHRSDDLDGLLRQFFQSEMPKNWPAPPRLPQTRRPQPRPWYCQPSRLALAAAVTFFLVGYLALANRFPSGNGRPGATLDPRSEFGQKPRLPKVLPPGKVELNQGIQLLLPEIAPTRSGRVESSGYRTPERKIYLHVKHLK